jgi:hypothetical protein
LKAESLTLFINSGFLDIAKVPELLDLENKINACTVFLSRMSNLLGGFQKDLGLVSSEIAVLQNRSEVLSRDLKNRQLVQSKLSNVLENTLVTPKLIKEIVESEVNEAYLVSLSSLNTIMKYIKSNKSSHIRAFKDVGPELERLRNKTSEKGREFFLEKFKVLRSSSTNLQMIQTNILLKYTPLNQFLMTWNPDVAKEVRGHYIYAISKYYQTLLEKYTKVIGKLMIPIADKTDCMGSDESKDQGFLSFFRGSMSGPPPAPGSTEPVNSFSIYSGHGRTSILKDAQAPVILAHVAEAQSTRYPIEVVMRSITRMLLDTLTTEFHFLNSFFYNEKKRLGTETAVSHAVFQQIMDPVFKSMNSVLTNWCQSSYDALGLACTFAIGDLHLKLIEERKLDIPMVPLFYQDLQNMIFARYQELVQNHAESLKKSKPTPRDTTPHFVSSPFLFFFMLFLFDEMVSACLLSCKTVVIWQISLKV